VKYQHTIEFREFRPEIIFSVQKRAQIKGALAFFLCRDWAQRSVDRWRDAVSPGSSPTASDDFGLLPCDISPDFLYRGAYHGIDAPGSKAPDTIFFLFACAI